MPLSRQLAIVFISNQVRTWVPTTIAKNRLFWIIFRNNPDRGWWRALSQTEARRESGSENNRQLIDVEEQEMKRTRKKHNPAFEAKMALTALLGVKP